MGTGVGAAVGGDGVGAAVGTGVGAGVGKSMAYGGWQVHAASQRTSAAKLVLPFLAWMPGYCPSMLRANDWTACAPPHAAAQFARCSVARSPCVSPVVHAQTPVKYRCAA